MLDPRFVERDGCVFFEGNFSEENFAMHWREQAVSDPRKTERTINHVHLSDLVDNLIEQRALGEQIREVWTKALALTFPDREFTIRLTHSKRGSGDWILDLESGVGIRRAATAMPEGDRVTYAVRERPASYKVSRAAKSAPKRSPQQSRKRGAGRKKAK